MMHAPRSRRPSNSTAQTVLAPHWRRAAAGSLIGLAAGWAATDLAAQDDPVTVSHGYSNFGELRYGPDFVHLDYVNPDAPKGGEISIWSQGTFDSFNQYARQGVPAALNTMPYEAILTSTSDDPYGLYCYLCTTLEYPESRDWVIFHLRDDVTFSDGSPMTADDIAFSFNLFLEQGITEYRNAVEGYIDSVEVIDPLTIRFDFTPEAPRRDVVGFAGGTPAFSQAWFQTNERRLDESTLEPFIGTGAYMMESYDINRQVIYGRNPNFWGADVPFNAGRNNFDRIRVEYFADSAAAFEGFKSGAYTFRTESSSKDWATGYDFPAIQNGWVVQEEIPDGNVGIAQSFVFNLDDPTWQDPRVREAIRLMFNFEWSNKTLFYGLYARPNSFWPNSDLEATGTPTPAEVALLQPLVDEGLLDAAILTDEAVMPPVSSEDSNTPDRSVYRRAGALLDEAGWVAGPDGIRMKDGQPLELVFLQFSPLFDRIVNPYIENLERLGVRGILDRVDSAQYVERRRSGDFDLANQSFQMGFEPGSGLQQWFSSMTADDSSRNLMRLRNPAVDRLVDVVIAARTLDDLRTSVHALDRVLRAAGFTVPQWFNDQTWVAYYDMYRHPETLPPFDTGELDFWWFDAEAAETLRAAGAFQ